MPNICDTSCPKLTCSIGETSGDFGNGGSYESIKASGNVDNLAQG